MYHTLYLLVKRKEEENSEPYARDPCYIYYHPFNLQNILVKCYSIFTGKFQGD